MSTVMGERDVVATRSAMGLLDKKAALLGAELLQFRQSLAELQSDFSETRAARLQEANEKLVLAAMQAESIAEIAAASMASLSRTFLCDAVTGTIHRSLMLDRLESAILMARRHRLRLAVMFVDLDSFKSINDSLGHAGGDEVLQLVTRAMQSVLRESDTVCRYGGDEFLVLLPEISGAQDAAQIAAEMLAAVSTPVSVGGNMLTLSASIGVSIFPEHGEDPVTLINRADAAMFASKRSGNGGFQFHSDQPPLGSRVVSGPLRIMQAKLVGRAWSPPAAEPAPADLREANAELVIAALVAQEAEAQARDAHRQQMKFMAMVAHELRSPLTPLRIAAGLLVNRSAVGELPIERLQQIIDGQVTHMTRLVDDLLDGARLSTGKLRLERISVDMLSVLDEVIGSSQPRLLARQHDFSVQRLPGPLMVYGDPVRLAQVFNNLLDNACKYTPEGGQIALEMAVIETTLIIRVRDNGIGIAPATLPTIFELFVQDVRSQVHSNGGLGIGLAVVRDLVEAHGGSVIALSAGRDHGSEFVVTLPLYLPPDALPAP
jgi:diguanylate cyclase (GGDEF)-like protein